MKIARLIRLGLLLSIVAITSTGCRGCMRENIVYEHCFNRPDCGPVARPCPPLIPEFNPPPAGGYGRAEVRVERRQKGHVGEIVDEVSDK